MAATTPPPHTLQPVASNMTDADNLQHHLDNEVVDDGSATQPDLYVCLEECYIYAEAGQPNGVPLDDSHIIYDTEIDEIIQLDVENDELKTKGNYVRCLKPREGWVYLPEPEAEYGWEKLDDLYARKKKAKENEKKEQTAKEKKDGDGDGDEDMIDKIGTNYDEDGYMKSEEDEEYKDIGDMDDMGDEEEDETLIEDMRRDYTKQKMMAQTKHPEIEWETNKCLQNDKLRKTLFYFRRHPFLPGLIILIIQAVIEGIIFFDIITDAAVALQLLRCAENSDGTHSKDEIIMGRMLFMLSCAIIAAPYIIAWTSMAAFNLKKLQQNRGHCGILIYVVLFSICPFGVAFLFLNDLYHLAECIAIKPLYYLLTFGKQFRTISYDELGYYKLRRVSEIFSEAIPQAIMQAVLLGTSLKDTLGLNWVVIVFGLVTSAIVLALWCTIIYVEGKKNGMKFAEYTTVVMQGSFDFVEMLPAIERGTATGIRVNWTMYKFAPEGVGHVSKALNSPSCKLEFLKISTYTISNLSRAQCRFLGGALAQSKKPVELVVTRLESELMELWDKYDVDKGKSLDFDEFMYLSLDLKARVGQPCYRSDVFMVYEELADSVEHEIWMLDLQVKIRGSQERINLLDYELPLQHAYETGDLNLMSLLMAYEYDQYSDENEAEFVSCVTRAVTDGDVQKALCLCEHKGVPMVVRMEKGQNLLAMDSDGKSDPYVEVNVFDIKKVTTYIKETLNPNWSQDLLFIIPFDKMESFKNDAGSIAASKFSKDSEPTFAYGGSEAGRSVAGQSFAAIDINGSVVHGLDLPEYCKTAIIQANSKKFNKEFHYETASSPADLSHTMYDSPGLERMGTNNDRFANTMSPIAESGQPSSELKIRFKVFDHDVNDQDDFMGSHKLFLNTTNDNSKYHEQAMERNLKYQQDPTKNAGSIWFKVFLNAFDKWQEHGLRYIDTAERKIDVSPKED